MKPFLLACISAVAVWLRIPARFWCKSRPSIRLISSSPMPAICGAFRREGGEAIRLTAGPGVETDPLFSPGRHPDRVSRRVRRQHGCLCHAGRRRRAEAADVSSRRRLPVRMDARTASASCSAPTRDSYSRFSRLFTVGSGRRLPCADRSADG